MYTYIYTCLYVCVYTALLANHGGQPKIFYKRLPIFSRQPEGNKTFKASFKILNNLSCSLYF